MKKNVITLLLLCSLLSQSFAQTDIPKGFVRGSIILFDSTSLKGYVKDELKSSATIIFKDENGSKRKVYDGDQVNSVVIDMVKFICVKGDFFKIILNGELSLLQKASDVSGKISYNGSDPYVRSGTDGKIDDYFFYQESSKRLIHLSKKGYQAIYTDLFNNRPDDLKKIQILDFSKESFTMISMLYDKPVQINN